jgi:hypothetical protein
VVTGIDTPAGEYEFSGQEHMTCVTSAKQNVWLVFRSINDDERGGIFGLDPRVIADTLSVNEMARY